MNISIKNYTLLRVYINVLWNELNKNGFIWLLKKAFLRGLKELIWVILLPIAMLVHFLGFRRLLIRVEHIGHLAAEMDTFIKAKKLGVLSGNYYMFILAPHNKVCNIHLLNYWQPYVFIIKNKALCLILSLLTKRFFMRYDVSNYISNFFGAQEIYQINRLWAERSPVLKLFQQDEKWGSSQLYNLGIKDGQWFVCVHVREGGFLPHNELIQSHRNASISNTFLGMQEIIRRGGMVVRMGDSTMQPLSRMDGVIDYAHHVLKSDRLDIFLCAKAKFFLGCSSGLSMLSMIFGVPVAHANMIPFETLGIRHCDLSIPKLLKKEGEGGYLSFYEIISSQVSGFFFTQQYTKAGIIYEENSPQDIELLVLEMLDRINGNYIESIQEEGIHAQYLSLFNSTHYSYQAVSRVCVKFLMKYQYLLNY